MHLYLPDFGRRRVNSFSNWRFPPAHFTNGLGLSPRTASFPVLVEVFVADAILGLPFRLNYSGSAIIPIFTRTATPF